MKLAELFNTVTTRIVEDLSKGVNPWVRPWGTDPALEWPMNPTTGKRYTGLNALWLNLSQGGFSTNQWATFKQIEAAGGMVKKGSKGMPVLRPIEITKAKEGAAEDGDETRLTLFKGYHVFNLDQADGLSHLRPAPRTVLNPVSLRPDIEAAIEKTGVPVRHEGNRCYYEPLRDRITMVEPGAFQSMQLYYCTKLHELTHATGHASRLNRLIVDRPPTKQEYGFEELVAEIGSAFLCQHLAIDGIDRHQSDYIGGWLEIIKKDEKAVFSAAGKAQAAFNYIIPNP